MHRLRGRLESCWQDHAPRADNPTHPITKHVIWKTQPQLQQKVPKQGRKTMEIHPSFTGTVSGFVGAVLLGQDEGLWLQLWRLIHCVMRTAGNGVTFAEGREDNAVTPDHSLPASTSGPCQAVSASADTLYQSSSACSSRPSCETAPS